MKLNEIAKARTTLQNAGTPADRNQLRDTLLSHLAKDVETLRQHMATVQSDFRRKLERWRTEEVPENVTVCALPSDMHDSRLYRATGIFALLCEMALAAWMFQWLGVGWWIGVATALGITLTLHGIFLHVFDNPERPKEAIYRLRTRVSLPAIFGFLVALAVGMLARYVNGSLAVLLLPAFSFALWVGTLSLLILASSLFTVAHIQGWSARHDKQYRMLGNEERETSAFQSELRAGETRTEVSVAPPVAVAASTFSSTAAGRAMGFLLAGLLTLSLVSSSGCATPVKSANVPEPAVVSDTSAVTMDAFVDTSGSCVRPALTEAWNTVRRELPELLQEHRITQLSIWQFDEDGWSPRRLREIPIPAMQVSARHQVPGTEWASFANIRDAVRDAEEKESRNLSVAAQQDYRNKLRNALESLEANQVLAEASHETPRSDIVGLLRRVSQASESAPQYILILTDLADTQHRTFPNLPPPQNNVRVIVLLVPAQANDARMTLGKALTGPEQFDIRVHQLQEAAPWVTVAPYFAHNLPELLGKSADTVK
jgi:hypothetical protein